MTPSHNGAHGTVHLVTDSDALTASVRLEATPDGKSLLLIDVDSRNLASTMRCAMRSRRPN
jgi:hypothetical protein